MEAAARSVRGVLRAAATAKAAVMPGIISKGMLCGGEGVDLFSGAAEDERVAGFEAEDGFVPEGVLEHEGVDAPPG